MQLRQHLLPLLTTPVIVSLAGQSAIAFSIILPSQDPPACNIYCSSITYTAQNFGTIDTYLAPIADVRGTFVDDLALNTLNSSVWAQNGWTFTLSTAPLQGNFTISQYRPYASLAFVGADILLSYNPAQGDPVGNTHWIQGVVSNHAFENNLSGGIDIGHGILENKVDVVTEQTNPNYIYPQNPGKQTFNPYYDTFARQPTNQTVFYDIPNRRDVQEPHSWLAALYMVQETAPKQVTLYNGFLWGWWNEFTPAPCTGGSGGGGCTQAVNGSGGGNIAVLPESVPETSSILGLLLLGVWGVIQGMKINSDKQQ